MALAQTMTLVGTAPASVTYTLVGRSANEVTFQDQRRGIVNQFGTLKYTTSQIRDSKQRMTGKYKAGLKLIEPVVRNVAGVDVVGDPFLFDGQYRLPGDATAAEKAHFVKVSQSAIAHAILGATLTTGEQFW